MLGVFHTLRCDDFELPVVLDATGVPDCIQACLSDLFYTAAELIHLQNPVDKFDDLCRSYENASLCIENQKDTCIQTTLFDIALSGLDELCNEKEEELLEHKQCLSEHAEMALKNCDRCCHFTNILIDFSGHGTSEGIQKLQENHESLVKEVSAVCTTFGCMSSCVAREINAKCPPAGTIITEALLKPFFTASAIFEEIGPRAKISIYRQVPPQCYYLINYEAVQGIANGKSPSKALANNPEEAIMKEIALKEQLRKQKKAELEKQFLLDAKQGI